MEAGLYRYQASAEQFARAGTDPNRVPDLCQSAVLLAADARRQYISGAHTSRRPKIALSIGPYGATLPAAEEYDGMYPPPFGPVGVSPSRNAPESQAAERIMSNIFNATASATPEEKEAEAHAEEALFDWHSRGFISMLVRQQYGTRSTFWRSRLFPWHVRPVQSVAPFRTSFAAVPESSHGGYHSRFLEGNSLRSSTSEAPP